MHNLNIIKQVGEDVEIDFYYKIVELKDFSFKSSIYDKSIAEAKKGTDITVEFMQKVLARYRKKGTRKGEVTE